MSHSAFFILAYLDKVHSKVHQLNNIDDELTVLIFIILQWTGFTKWDLKSNLCAFNPIQN